MNLWRTLASGLMGGLISGAVFGLLVVLFVSPLILRAEVREESYLEHETNQRAVGTVVGSLVLGTVYGLGVAAAYARAARDGRLKPVLAGLLLGAGGFMAVTLLPGLALPPRLPGLRSVASVDVQQRWWLAMVLLNVAVVYLSVWAWSVVRGRGAWVRVVAAAAPWPLVAVPFLAGPPNRLLPTGVSASAIMSFRVASTGSLLVFWLLLGVLVALSYAYSEAP